MSSPPASDASIHADPTDAPDGSQQPPHTPRLTARHIDRSEPFFSDSSVVTPRSQRARNCLDALSDIPQWEKLVETHVEVLRRTERRDLYNDDDLKDQLNTLARNMIENKVGLTNVVPELYDVLTDKISLINSLGVVYQSQLARRFLDWRTEGENAHAFAYLLIHLAKTHIKVSNDGDVLKSNSHLTLQFGRHYRGDAPIRFLHFVTKLNHKLDLTGFDQDPPYFRGTPIVQSSGTGKSRMVIELSSLTPLLYVCFRSSEASGNAKAGYPLPDQGVRKYFEDANQSNPNLCDLQVACFLQAWFDLLCHRLRELPDVAAKKESLLRLNRLDRDNPERIAFFQQVTEVAEINLANAPSECRVQPSIVREENGSTNTEQEHANDRVFRDILRDSIVSLNHELALISDQIHQASSSTGVSVPPVLVAFDECVEINVSNEPKGNNQLNSLLRAWHYMFELENSPGLPQRFWLVLLSTSNSAAALVEHVSVQSSLRRQSSAPLPTFVGIGFDMLAVERPSIASAEEAWRFDQIVTYGRPLWASLDATGFWRTVTVKLQGALKFDPRIPAQCFSVLASRLALRLVPTQWGNSPLMGQQKVFLDEAVDRHMRIVTYVTEQASMYVDSPSEPVLAIAASLIMLSRAMEPADLFARTVATNRYGAILHQFRTRCLLSRQIPMFKGTDGELAARIVLTVAWDAIKERALSNRTSTLKAQEQATILSEAVLLDNLIANLATLEPSHLVTLQRRIESVEGKVSLRDPFAKVEAWTHFTHFDVLPHGFSEITPEYLWYCWKRGVALQMAHEQGGIDGIIPVFIGDLTRPFVTSSDRDATGPSVPSDVPYGAQHMTYVAWEAKNRKAAQPSAQDKSDPRSLEILRKLAGPAIRKPVFDHATTGIADDASTIEPLTERALFCILFDFGTNTPFRATRNQNPQVEIIRGTQCPRLCIRGVTDSYAYPCLDHFHIRTIFSDILGDTDAAQSINDDEDNVVPHPLWNKMHQPILPVPISAAATTYQVGGGSEQRMELD